MDVPVLLELQKQLTKYTYDTRRWQLGERPGAFKLHDYVTGKEKIGALPEDIPAEIAKLLEEIQDVEDRNALTAAACFHAKFEHIHPFADGNGRTGRLAMNDFLVIHHHPPVIVHQEDRRGYFAALEAWDSGQELSPLVAFLRDQTAETWEKQIAKTERHQARREPQPSVVKRMQEIQQEQGAEGQTAGIIEPDHSDPGRTGRKRSIVCRRKAAHRVASVC